jgi:2,4-dienoyl-CoA reductase (NADPH2)
MKVAAGLSAPVLDRAVTPARLRTVSDYWLPVGKRVVLLGGDLAAIELAEFLAKRGRDVALFTEEQDIATEIGPKRRLEHEHRLERLKVSLNTSVHFDAIEAHGAAIVMAGGRRVVARADTVIVAGTPVADANLYDALKAAGLSSHAIGDCTGLGLIVKAVYEGAELANRL